MRDKELRSKLIRLAHSKPHLRRALLPLLGGHTRGKRATDMSVWRRLRPGDVISVSTPRFSDPAMVVQYWGDENTMPPYDEGMLVARKVSDSATFWIFPEGGGLVIEDNNSGRKMPVLSLEATGATSRPSHRRANRRQARMSDEARELELYIENDYEIYRQLEAVRKNLQRHWSKGRFDPMKAIKGFMYPVDAGAKKYFKEFGSPGMRWSDMFPKSARMEVAKSLAEDFAEEVEDM